MLACGFLAQSGERAVWGCLPGRDFPGPGRRAGRAVSSPAPDGTPVAWGLPRRGGLLVPGGEAVEVLIGGTLL